MQKKELMNQVKKYFDTYQNVNLNKFIEEIKSIYDDVEKNSIKPYVPVQVEELQYDLSSYEQKVNPKKASYIQDDDLSVEKGQRSQNIQPDKDYLRKLAEGMENE